MVPESIMKIFLMIAVIIVGMAFLMKAFGIDIFGWLKNKLEWINIPESGKALNVRITPNQNNVGLWEFHLVPALPTYHLSHQEQKDNFYFSFKNAPNDKCLILVSHEIGRAIDQGNFYDVSSGGRIQYDCNNNQNPFDDSIKSCLNLQSGICTSLGSYESEYDKCVNCVNKKTGNSVKCFEMLYYYVGCGDGGGGREYLHRCENDPEYAGGDTKVVDIQFRDADKSEERGCKENPSECILLKKNEKKEFVYLVQYGLICDNGIWRTCKPNKDGVPDAKPVTVGNTIYNCIKDGEDWFVWKGKSSYQTPLCPYLDNTDCPDNKPIKDICTGECKPSSSCTFQGTCTSNLVMNPCSGQCVRTQ